MVLLAGYAVDMMQKCSVYSSFAYELISCLRSMKYIQQYALGEAVLKTHLYYTDWTIFNVACSFNFECMLCILFVLIQPRGCYIPIKVVVVVTKYDYAALTVCFQRNGIDTHACTHHSNCHIFRKLTS